MVKAEDYTMLIPIPKKKCRMSFTIQSKTIYQLVSYLLKLPKSITLFTFSLLAISHRIIDS